MFYKLPKAHFRYWICFVHYLRFLKKVSKGAHFSSLHTRGTKSLNKAQVKKCAPEFLILSALKLPSCELLVFTNMNTYMLTEDTNLKRFLKEKYSIALDCCNLHIY